MGTLTKTNPNARELVTETLDEALCWGTLRLIVGFLLSKRIERVRIEFGFILDRELEAKPQPQSRIVQLVDLESVIKRGIDEGTIEWAGNSDFLFNPMGADLAFMFCNDADLHFASADSSLLMELVQEIRASGIKVYDSGNLI